MIREKDVFDMIKNTYQDGYSVIGQVRNATGFKATRTADALIFCHWPSRGISISGVEIKVARADWLRELSEPSKAEEIAQYCDYWYVAAPPKVANIDELPENWGLMVTLKNKVKIIKKAKKLEPLPLTSTFVSSIMKRFYEQEASEEDLVKQYNKGYELGFKDGNGLEKDRLSFEFRNLEKRLFILQERVRKFEEASGINIDGWKNGRMGDAVKRVIEGDQVLDKLTYAKNNIKRALEHMTTVLVDIDNITDGK